MSSLSLAEWRNQMLPKRRMETFRQSSLSVTVLIYHFWPETETECRFDETEFAILQTWHCCGKLQTVIVCDKPCQRMTDFKADHENVSIHTSPLLVPGCVKSMSYDCNANMASYFDTDYVLVIQNDGFPLRPGLEDFLGRYDYWGAPFSSGRLAVLLEFLCRCSVGNGGFSLRTKKICRLANRYWPQVNKLISSYYWLRDDVYYCLTLRLLRPTYMFSVNYPTRKEAVLFSYDRMQDIPTPKELPYGFHGVDSFRMLEQVFAHTNEIR